MLSKAYSRSGRLCRVTFQLSAEVSAQRVTICGDFNEWDTDCDYLDPLPGGGFSGSLLLQSGREYRFRYLLDGRRWEIDQGADGYHLNPLGAVESVIQL